MKKTILSIIAVLALSTSMNAQNLKYFSADEFPLYGKVTENTAERYTRFPAEMKDTLRKALWDLGMDSAGMCVRFRTNSTTIAAKWTSIYGLVMNHMPATGIRGLDLYTLIDGEWWQVRCTLPSTKKESERTFISDMTPEMREYMFYLPLYDGIRDFEIGIDSTAVIEQPVFASPTHNKPIVMYGTSILQGGCVSRPGMASTNIISRKLHREVINLGFSGNAFLDPVIADYMASVPDPGVYVMDNLPNCNAKRVAERTRPFVQKLRDAHPDVPIIFIEDPHYIHAYYSQKDYNNMKASNDSLKVIFNQLKKEGWKDIYYVEGARLNGEDREGTVDGSHFTDLGMTKYVEIVLPVIKKAMKLKK